jgi:hypothetical protein
MPCLRGKRPGQEDVVVWILRWLQIQVIFVGHRLFLRRLQLLELLKLFVIP